MAEPSRLTQAREQKPMPPKLAAALLKALSEDHHAAAKALDLGARALAVVEQFTTLLDPLTPDGLQQFHWLQTSARDLMEGR